MTNEKITMIEDRIKDYILNEMGYDYLEEENLCVDYVETTIQITTNDWELDLDRGNATFFTKDGGTIDYYDIDTIKDIKDSYDYFKDIIDEVD